MPTAKRVHEVRDAIHAFVRLDSTEREVLDCPALQRLRYIHQLGLSHLVYPGATHKRLEHSLGVMELAGRVFDVVTNADFVTDQVKELIPEVKDRDTRAYWRRVLRMAALCHDVGHLPFSHGAEDLFPRGWDHERLTAEIIMSDEMSAIWRSMTPPLRAEDIAKLAVGAEKAAKLTMGDLTDWETILSEIIVGDAFGVDRMDYLLRDSLHAGVAYGRFDHYRLIDTLRILTPPPSKQGEESKEPTLGVEEGGLHSAEALLLARYFMFTQVYWHPVRRIYDIHLKDFLSYWLPSGRFSKSLRRHIQMTDNEVMSALRDASSRKSADGHDHAVRIIGRRHFKLVYERNPGDLKVDLEAAEHVYRATCSQFGAAAVRKDIYRQGDMQEGAQERTQDSTQVDFPVLTRRNTVESAVALSDVLKRVPLAAAEYVFVAPDVLEDARKWLTANRTDIIAMEKEEDQ